MNYLNLLNHKDKSIVPNTVTNIFKITPKIGCLATGMLRILFKDYLIILADAKTMVTWLRMEAAEYKFDNGH